MTNVLLIGNGAREHAIADAVSRSDDANLFVYAKAKNPGMVSLAKEYNIGDFNDSDEILEFAKKVGADFAIIGPENPIADGVGDKLLEIGVKSVAPLKSSARLESSKSFARDLVSKYDIPANPEFKTFTSTEGIKEFMEHLNSQFVVKADGLTGGKGVKVVGDHLEGIEDGFDYAKECIESDGQVVVEEKLIGEEFSLMSFCDGTNVTDMPAVQDHKRAYVDDKGPNTGGMGTYSDSDHSLPFLTQKDIDDAHKINQLVCDAIKKECNEEFKGIMYGGFIATANGVRLIEYNVRFGDPEAMNVLPILKTDFVKVCSAIIDGTLDKLDVEFENKATVCKYAVPEGYPDNPISGEKVDISEVNKDAILYFASVDQKEDGLYMSSSRAIGFVGVSDTLEQAEQIAESAVKNVKGKIFYRPDIGTKELIEKRITHMKELRP